MQNKIGDIIKPVGDSSFGIIISEKKDVGAGPYVDFLWENGEIAVLYSCNRTNYGNVFDTLKQLERYKSALDTAKGALVGISMPEIQTEMFDSVRFAQIALELITQALGKEEK